MVKNGKLFVISAPSGAGKTTLVRMACNRLKDRCSLEQAVTYTTKKPRPGERDGEDYHFLTIDAFQQKIQEDFFIEWSVAYGHYYGSPRSILDDIVLGKSFIVIVDRTGAQAIANKVTQSVLIWIYTKSIDILSQRLLARKTENKEQILKRLALAVQELQDEQHNAFFTYHVLNDHAQNALQEIESIIVKELED
jgi:guanylate kinase